MPAKIKKGAIQLSRTIIDHKIFYQKPDKWFKIWIYIICYVNHKSNNHFSRGSGFINYKYLEIQTGATRNQIYKCIKWLKKEGMIATDKTTRGVIINVINYNLYQELENYKKDIKKARGRYKGDTINNNDNNDNNDKGGNNVVGIDEDGRKIYSVNGKYRVKGADGTFYDFAGKLNKNAI